MRAGLGRAVSSALLGCLLMAGGCGERTPVGEPSTTVNGAPDASANLTAEELLPQMQQAYRDASSYRDEGELRLSYRDAQGTVSDATPFSVCFERPGKLRMRAYRVDAGSDGKLWRIRVLDPESHDHDGQVVVRPAAPQLTLDDVYQDGALVQMVRQQMGDGPPQLDLLLGAGELSSPDGAQVTKRLETPAEIDGRTCYRLRIGEAPESYLFWIDQASLELLRLEYPTRSLAEQLPGAEEVRLVAEFRQARLGAACSAEDFEVSIPDGAKQVRYFVPLPNPIVTQLYSQAPETYAFAELGGVGELPHTELRGKPAVLVWFNASEVGEAILTLLAQAAAQHAEQAHFIAVAVTPELSDAQLTDWLRERDLRLHVVRDRSAVGKESFGIEGLPTMITLDARGAVQTFDVGYDPSLAEQIPLVLRLLGEGYDVGRQTLARIANEQAVYRQDLAAAGAEGISGEIPIAERSEPRVLSRERVWSNAELKAPGNLLALSSLADEPLVLLEGLQSRALIDATGESLESRQLDLPPESGISLIRALSRPLPRSETAPHGGVEWLYLAGTRGGKQVSLFDFEWNLLFHHPDEPLHEGIVDLQLAALAGADGPLVCLAYRHGGVHGVGLDGKRRWVQRACEHPVGIAPFNDGGGTRLCVSTEEGKLFVLGGDGEVTSGPLGVSGWPIDQLFPCQFRAPQATVLVGISYDPRGQRVAVGLDRGLREVWNYPMPAGVFSSPLEFVASGHLFGDESDEQWVFVSPEGGVHVVAADGGFSDQFHYGAAIRGVTVGPPGLLVIANDKGLEAWRLTAPEGWKKPGGDGANPSVPIGAAPEITAPANDEPSPTPATPR